MIIALCLILVAVLILPFLFPKVEENLEFFLFIMGITACIIAGQLSLELILEAIHEPVWITLAVLVAGVLFFLVREKFTALAEQIFNRVPLPLIVFLIIVLLGMISSIITAIVAAIILVELIVLLPVPRKQQVFLCILACFAIGFGAALTPIGEPLATIAISKLNQNFFYLFNLLGVYVIPAILVMGILGAFYVYREGKKEPEITTSSEPLICAVEPDIIVETDDWKGIIIRALKVYLFVMALVFLGQGFQPIINAYVLKLDYHILYWVNMVSAVLDNATLTAAEVSIKMSSEQIKAILMGLLISGGMLIPGNIPNIISASKLCISMKEWTKIGVPMGLIIMGIYYFILF
ncbi:MAG: DUF1646 family protein [Syntrophomonadaceae bacterium]|nr:DUF1646 family protein [Syntrophomonadaceae bacterium]MDD3889566.1 DUF1646 family protein [Syntrophomonadaceae bacterium]MDD4550136.1 DUF1646 family protein [Syntrophomonadaceae bacterium]